MDLQINYIRDAEKNRLTIFRGVDFDRNIVVRLDQAEDFAVNYAVPLKAICKLILETVEENKNET